MGHDFRNWADGRNAIDIYRCSKFETRRCQIIQIFRTIITEDSRSEPETKCRIASNTMHFQS